MAENLSWWREGNPRIQDAGVPSNMNTNKFTEFIVQHSSETAAHQRQSRHLSKPLGEFIPRRGRAGRKTRGGRGEFWAVHTVVGLAAWRAQERGWAGLGCTVCGEDH